MKAEPVKFYRAQLKADLPAEYQVPGLAEKEVSEHISRVRALLNVNSGDLSTLLKLSEVPEIRKNQRTSSSVLKSNLAHAIDQLYQMDQYEKPETFDPSKTKGEVLADIASKRKALVEKVLQPNWNKMISEINVRLSQPADNGYMADWKAEREVAVKLQTIIPAEITQALGNLESLTIFEGVVTRLDFKKGDIQSPVSIPMLVNIRTLKDDYYLLAQEILLDLMESKMKTYYKTKKSEGDIQYQVDEKGEFILRSLKKEEAEEFVKIKNAYELVIKKYKGAREAHERISVLSESQIHWLLDLLIQLRAENWVAGFEVMPLQLRAGQDGESQATIDALFYKDLYQSLYDLEEFLTQEQEAKKLQQKLMEDVDKNRDGK